MDAPPKLPPPGRGGLGVLAAVELSRHFLWTGGERHPERLLPAETQAELEPHLLQPAPEKTGSRPEDQGAARGRDRRPDGSPGHGVGCREATAGNPVQIALSADDPST